MTQQKRLRFPSPLTINRYPFRLGIRMHLALFDFDGTITHEDMFSLFLKHSASPQRKWLGRIAIMPFYTLYKLKLLPAHVMRPIASWVAFRGRDAHQLKQLGKRFAAEVIPHYLRVEAMEKLAWHQAKGDRIILVSASLDLYLAPWCQTQGIELLCSEMKIHHTALTGTYLNGDCSQTRKVARVKAHCDIDQYPRIYAYGDTDEDRPMLALADEAYFQWERVAPEG
ncbi:TPA: HAD-IB family hydrolase [Vibrio vulnificus]|nr:HAD-IB family hydrolase [Vibrio vulnificus]HAS6056086.1 HAD-IB family hydrolase [Vibrio vulnificus]HAS6118566.1 HAD-IB family hydrolase [Vibrio vulnificus]HAS6132424.1 HAD-IB family hydrolase [Vibrio vulnificus]HAS6219601.1 HAD-IB family hydrolase [Vibrio vulnificus]